LAQRIGKLTGQIRDLERRLAELVERHFPQVLVPVGIGPDSAATLLITMGDNPERLRSEASFAALCGVSPVEYSPGRRRRYRLNRGGDRRANVALYRIVQSRLRFDMRTRTYDERRIAEGKTRREVIRCPKRFREVFHLVWPHLQGLRRRRIRAYDENIANRDGWPFDDVGGGCRLNPPRSSGIAWRSPTGTAGSAARRQEKCVVRIVGPPRRCGQLR
jgi:hypothetical protein